MQIMTFNIRFENDFDGENCWENRKELVTEIVADYKPAILGTQEGTVGQLRYLERHLSGYRLHAPERLWDDGCQYCSIFYRDEDVRPLGGGEFWLSDTPKIHRSKGWDSAFPRMISYGIFEDIASGRHICAAVTHLDNVGAEARRQQAGIICEWLGEQNRPSILMGDFNDRPQSTVHQIFTEKGLLDTWQVLRRSEDQNSFTYHKFQGVPLIFRMDWIFITPTLHVSDARVIHDHSPAGRYPSDHFPYLVRLEWAKQQTDKQEL
jgi:endonuclease/exonuclease/phosphatase family metal-dependent hydrolase